MNFSKILYKIKTVKAEYSCFNLADLLVNLDLSEQSLLLIRGLPGCGKGESAKAVCEKFNNTVHFEADMYFQKGDKYLYKRSQLKNAHKWCYYQTVESLSKGFNVCVANTFIEQWEIQEYLDAADFFKINLVIIECAVQQYNTQKVFKDKIEQMKGRWEIISIKKEQEIDFSEIFYDN